MNHRDCCCSMKSLLILDQLFEEPGVWSDLRSNASHVLECCLQWHVGVFHKVCEHEGNWSWNAGNTMNQTAAVFYSCLFDHISNFIKIFNQIWFTRVFDWYSEVFWSVIGQRCVWQFNRGVHNKFDFKVFNGFRSYNCTCAAKVERRKHLRDSKVERKLAGKRKKKKMPIKFMNDLRCLLQVSLSFIGIKTNVESNN